MCLSCEGASGSGCSSFGIMWVQDLKITSSSALNSTVFGHFPRAWIPGPNAYSQQQDVVVLASMGRFGWVTSRTLLTHEPQISPMQLQQP